MKRILYTLGRPEPELAAIRQLIAERTGLVVDHIYSPSAREQYGRVYYAVVDSSTQRGLIFTIGRRLHPDAPVATQYVSEWEVKAFFKLAQTLNPGRVYSMLAPLRLFEDEIQAVVLHTAI